MHGYSVALSKYAFEHRVKARRVPLQVASYGDGWPVAGRVAEGGGSFLSVYTADG